MKSYKHCYSYLSSIFAPCPKGRWLHEQNQPIYSYPQHSYKPRGRCCQQWYHLPISFIGLPCLLVPGTISIRMRLGRCMLLILQTWPNQDSCDSVMRARILMGLNLQEEILKRNGVTAPLKYILFKPSTCSTKVNFLSNINVKSYFYLEYL